jgi:SAM-dependent methyltransferase
MIRVCKAKSIASGKETGEETKEEVEEDRKRIRDTDKRKVKLENPSQRIWSANEAEAWNLIIPPEQTAREVSFLLSVFRHFAHEGVHEILDLGCGAGRLAIELSAKGYIVTGVDNSPTMLKIARRNADERQVKLRLLRSQLSELKITGRFDAAYSVQDPFNYVLEEKELSNSLARLKSLLRPGGVLVVDIMNFASLYSRWKRVLKQTSRGKNWIIHTRVSHEVDDVNMLWYHRLTTQMVLHGRTRRWKETHVLRMWTFPEFRNQLIANGFSDVHVFGSLREGIKEATTHAPHLVIVATRSPSD